MNDNGAARREWADRWISYLWKRADEGVLTAEQASRTTGFIVGAVAGNGVSVGDKSIARSLGKIAAAEKPSNGAKPSNGGGSASDRAEAARLARRNGGAS